jgi:hypothetical protein
VRWSTGQSIVTTALLVSNGIANARHSWATSVNLRHHGERKLADLLLAELTSPSGLAAGFVAHSCETPQPILDAVKW